MTMEPQNPGNFPRPENRHRVSGAKIQNELASVLKCLRGGEAKRSGRLVGAAETSGEPAE